MGCFDNIDEFRESKRYLSKENTSGIRGVYTDIWKNYINLYGVQTAYYPHGYTLKTQDDFIYGEDATEPFKAPKIINMMVEYQTDALLLSKFGLESTADLNAVVSIEDYQNIFGIGHEPKAGDVIELTEAAWETAEMPLYDGMLSHFNIIAEVDSISASIVVGIDVDPAMLVPVKGGIAETTLSYAIPMYTTSDDVSANMYPIENPLISLFGELSSSDYLSMSVSGETYLTPLYIPAQTVERPSINSLYFNYDVVALNGDDIESVGYFPFEYNDAPLLMPVYQYTTSGDLATTVTEPAIDLSHITMDAKMILCQSLSGYPNDPYSEVSDIKLNLADVYGAKFIRYPQLFEITEVKYQDYSQQVNFAQGHYVWTIHAKRFDYSFEPGISSEGPMDQVYDNSFFGTLSSFENEPAPEKVYPQEIEEASDKVWEYSPDDSKPYGYY